MLDDKVSERKGARRGGWALGRGAVGVGDWGQG